MTATGTYVNLHELTNDPNWKKNISPSVNSVLSDDFRAQPDNVTGDLDVINEGSKEMAGGLVSNNVLPLAASRFFGLDICLGIDPGDFKHLARCENDLKITLAGGVQANGSCQWNPDKGIWQLGANDGAGWVDTDLKTPMVPGENRIQLRLAFDGKVWSITGLKVNDSDPYIPAAKFQNLPAAQTGWGPGLHPQLQTEIKKAPYVLQESFHRVRVLESDGPIPYSFD
jgi:hypothetical protein